MNENQKELLFSSRNEILLICLFNLCWRHEEDTVRPEGRCSSAEVQTVNSGGGVEGCGGGGVRKHRRQKGNLSKFYPPVKGQVGRLTSN